MLKTEIEYVMVDVSTGEALSTVLVVTRSALLSTVMPADRLSVAVFGSAWSPRAAVVVLVIGCGNELAPASTVAVIFRTAVLFGAVASSVPIFQVPVALS